eukprot:CAMPEP_0179078056 /NCGR_PEP_ID=MMETSP0796-20121207/34929_1 /TAXON_ID=73915 /ORGANISM="Pyrodinium bahamense, Strain pbaha01" /LENGTH=373 /DNA_ID=CAMNT_0020775347 /DNA_START=48 /DNA_END=1169 /DNA_ORIENTATION=-
MGDTTFAVTIPPPPGLSAPASLTPGVTNIDQLSPQSVRELPSLGSAVHGSGECRPCAWFWKPQGCQNGKECRHCHLCPEGEIKARKKEKVESLRHEKQEQEQQQQQQPQPPQQQQQQQPQQQQHQQQQRRQSLHTGPACATTTGPLCLPLMPPPSLPSIGSSLHGTGMCRPCAWFWKPQGCENGLDCCHCHLCPEGEIKARRKMKVAVLRHQGAMNEQLELQQEQMGHWEFQWEAQRQAAEEFYQGQQQALQSDEDGIPEGDDTPLVLNGVGHSPFVPPVPLDLSASLDSPLPSTGSALHSLGKCRPCAWFWKSKGCLNGQACAHCHLCPEGELKVRKKVKETAMRIGALMPARRGLDARSPRIVKIAPVLGA